MVMEPLLVDCDGGWLGDGNPISGDCDDNDHIHNS